MTNRPSFGPRPASQRRTGDQDRDRNRFRERRRQFNNWYTYIYPAWPGYTYPYLIDPGFYDWGDSDDSAYEQGSASPNYPAPYPEQGYGAPEGFPPQSESEELPPPSGPRQQFTTAGSTTPYPSPFEQSLTVIFKGGRAPATMQNYMMTTTVLTDLDSHHYEQIPLDQIDVAATQRANRANGVDFQIPSASRN